MGDFADLPIAVLDSGVGGISVLSHLVAKMPNERFLYVADNLNAPYGNRTKDEIYDLVITNVRNLEGCVKGIVLACNTASSVFLERANEGFNCPIFTITPSRPRGRRKESCVLFCTARTAEFFRRKKGDGLCILPCENLARVIEEDPFNDAAIFREIEREKKKISTPCETVILGCTHYALKRELFESLFPNAGVFDGISALARRVKNGVEKRKSEMNGESFIQLFLSKDHFSERIAYLNLFHKKIYQKKYIKF